ncbi:MAG: hypothetical protein JXR82_14450 [Marinifilaceae bacterium]|nr:hypothetical protein [Marinifilaceae bacterium]
MKKHIFFVSSNFHLTICLGIINERQLSNKDFLFVNNRGCVFPNDLKSNVISLNGSNCFHFKEKLIESLKNNSALSILNDEVHFTAYIPFFRQLPYAFFEDIVFFEEGFASYSNTLKYSRLFKITQSIKNLIKHVVVNVFLIGKSRNLKCFVKGPLYNYSIFKSNKGFEYYTLSGNVAKSDFSNVDLKVLTIKSNVICEDVKHNSLVLVLDRFAAPTPYTINNYIIYLKKIIAVFKKRFIYVKFHPADYTNIKSRAIINDLFNFENINFSVINTSLEELALSNKNITFVGTNSTLLFYAPKFGNNKSISFVKYLASIDGGYYDFLNMWGGIDKFTNIFMENVEIYEE